ncbi:MAG: Gfo/Idh/MocA family oxidoreductase, partial [Neisseriaceae bacterium]|nr:Gfo/Idh/MocA family oxidoreductase [Neisseriaceae bacterium]
MTTNNKTKVAIIGSGNIGSDLMMKIIHHSHDLHLAAMIGVDPASDGLARARQLGVATSHEGIDGLLALPNFAEIRVVFDATSAGAHERHHQALQAHDVVLIDLTPAAIGPYVVPVVNLDE